MQRRHTRTPTSRAITLHAGHAHLYAHVTKAALHELARIVEDFGNFGAFGVRIAVHGLTALSAEHLINRHAGHPAFDVPQRFVHTADSVVEDRSVAPI